MRDSQLISISNNRSLSYKCPVHLEKNRYLCIELFNKNKNLYLLCWPVYNVAPVKVHAVFVLLMPL